MKIKDIVKEKYKEIISSDNGSSVFNVDLHIHTPGSVNEYEINDECYEDVTYEKIKNYVVDRGLYNNDQFDKLEDELETSKEDLSIEELKEELKDKIMAELIVEEAINSKLNLIVITDHNTVSWYKKVKRAKKRIIRRKKEKNYFTVLPGVEITVNEERHVIAILNPKDYNYEEQWDSIKRDLNFFGTEGKAQLATSKSILETIKIIKDNEGITYLPHLDTYKDRKLKELVKGQTWRHIFNSEELDLVGLNKLKRKKIINNKLNTKRKLAFISDSDAHCLNEIGDQYVKIKMQFPNFKNLNNGIRESNLRMNRKFIEEEPDISILGVAIKGGFLANPNNDKQWQLFPFNKDLNCILGGRGTGKSTLIDYIISLFKQKLSRNKIKFLGQAELILIYFKLKGKIYCVKGKLKTPALGNNLGLEYKDIQGMITVFKLNLNNNNIKLNHAKKNKILNKLRPDSYSQTEINSIGKNPDKLNKWFENLIINQLDVENSYKNIKNQIFKKQRTIKAKIYKIFEGYKKREYIKKQYKEIKRLENKLHNIYRKIIKKINEILIGKIKIKLDLEKDYTKNLRKIIINYPEYIEDEKKKLLLAHLDFLREISFIDLLIKLVEEDFEYIIDKTGMEIELENSFANIEKGINKIDATEILEYLRNIVKCNLEEVIGKLFNKIKSPNIKVKLNVNSYKNDSKETYKPLSQLSYGQRNVAILTLILEGFTNLNLTNPLIIDQPEDQLDNAYISEHLVENIRKIKGKRQIIFVTHNSNIPVYGDAENVLCLKSNGENGWIHTKGAIDKNSNLHFIIEYLEGGNKALQMRLKKYDNLVSFQDFK